MSNQILPSPLWNYSATFDAIKLIKDFAAYPIDPDPHCATNFLGVRVPAYVHHARLDREKNTVEPLPFPGNWHADIAEWAAVLRTVYLAREKYCFVEVGCGWACWLNNAGAAAKSRGLKCRLVGIDGEPSLLKKAKKILNLNGYRESEYDLFHGVAAPDNKSAIFPLNQGYGAEPIFSPTEEQLNEYRNSKAHIILESYTLSDLNNSEEIDLVHIDIQGAEYDFINANYAHLESMSKRVFIGTHSRVIEGKISEFLLKKGWKLEIERPAVITINDGVPKVVVDGVQMWKNPSQ